MFPQDIIIKINMSIPIATTKAAEWALCFQPGEKRLSCLLYKLATCCQDERKWFNKGSINHTEDIAVGLPRSRTSQGVSRSEVMTFTAGLYKPGSIYCEDSLDFHKNKKSVVYSDSSVVKQRFSLLRQGQNTQRTHVPAAHVKNPLELWNRKRIGWITLAQTSNTVCLKGQCKHTQLLMVVWHVQGNSVFSTLPLAGLILKTSCTLSADWSIKIYGCWSYV